MVRLPPSWALPRCSQCNLRSPGNFAQALSSLNGIQRNVTQRPDVENTALFLCDLQEKFRPVIHEMAAAIDTSRLMLAASIELGLPVAVTEQYPRGLGHTVSELSNLLTPEHTVVEKVTFSMMCGGQHEDPASFEKMTDFIMKNDIRKVLICGVEAHVCVLQTTLDLCASLALSPLPLIFSNKSEKSLCGTV